MLVDAVEPSCNIYPVYVKRGGGSKICQEGSLIRPNTMLICLGGKQKHDTAWWQALQRRCICAFFISREAYAGILHAIDTACSLVNQRVYFFSKKCISELQLQR